MLVPYLALAALMIIFFVMVGNLIVEVSMKAMRESPNPPAVMPSANVMKVSTIGGGVIAMLISPLLIAGLAMLWGNFMMGGAARFKQILSVTLYAEVLYGAGMVVTGLLMLYKHSMLISLSAAALLSNPNPQSWLFVLLSKIGVFYIWELIVLGIGLSVVYGFSRNKGYLLSVLSMGLLSAIQIVWTAIMS